MMTQMQFLVRLRELRERHPEYKVRYFGSNTVAQRIRLVGPDDFFCPITFVAYVETGVPYSGYGVWGAGCELKLSPQTAQRIIVAADNWNEFEWESSLQRQLGAALGVK